MIQSMTGFGRGVATLPDKKVTIEIKSLNSKQMDLFSRVAPVYREKEMDMRSLISQRLERGKVELTVAVEYTGIASDAKINTALVASYKQQIDELSRTLGIPAPTEWFPTLLRLPDVVRTDAEEIGEDEWQTVQTAINAAIDRLCEFRSQEGAMLYRLFKQKIEQISLLLKQIDRYEAERIEKLRGRITDNLQNIPDVQIDTNRLEQEMIYYIEKLDVNEEKSRLANHLKYFLQTLDNGHGQGKKLGFISQEIGREINTLGSKSNHAEMQKLVVRMKDELEQIKEQTLNVL
jgi:uncharacterized protein (TIGR00255 family)